MVPRLTIESGALLPSVPRRRRHPRLWCYRLGFIKIPESASLLANPPLSPPCPSRRFIKISKSIKLLASLPLSLYEMPHGASRVVHAMLVWSVKARLAPPRRCRDARVCGLTCCLPGRWKPDVLRRRRCRNASIYGLTDYQHVWQ